MSLSTTTLDVVIAHNTSFEHLCPAPDHSLRLLRIPASVTDDGGTPYQSQIYVDYAKKKKFDGRFCTPGPTESNGIAKRFMSVLNRTFHAAITKSKNPKVEVRGQLMNYPNTP